MSFSRRKKKRKKKCCKYTRLDINICLNVQNNSNKYSFKKKIGNNNSYKIQAVHTNQRVHQCCHQIMSYLLKSERQPVHALNTNFSFIGGHYNTY